MRMKMRGMNVLLAIGLMTSVVWAGAGDNSSFGYDPGRAQIAQAMSQAPVEEPPAQEPLQEVEIKGKLVPGKALLLSAIIPGTGQFYAKSPFWGAAFLALEIGAWAGVATFHAEGMDLEKEYKAYVDKYWTYYDDYDDPSMPYFDYGTAEEEFTYLEYEYYVATTVGHDTHGEFVGSLETWEGKTWSQKQYYLPTVGFTHELDPKDKDQQYYEMVGKYDQFAAGWPDADDQDDPFIDNTTGQATWRFSTLNTRRETYLNMRKDSNDALDMSKNFTMVVLTNHLISALHAGFTVTRHNKKLAREQSIEGAFQLEPRRINDVYVTMGSVCITF